MIIDWLATNGFEKAGGIELRGDRPIAFADPSCFWSGGVYAWIAQSASGAELLYIGKAGTTLSRRCAQHCGGFSGKSRSKAGLRNGQAIRERIARGETIEIWAREAARVELFGQTVSLHSTEEEALILKFNPPLNRGGRSTEARSDALDCSA